jgi:hypothetical protein
VTKHYVYDVFICVIRKKDNRQDKALHKLRKLYFGRGTSPKLVFALNRKGIQMADTWHSQNGNSPHDAKLLSE